MSRTVIGQWKRNSREQIIVSLDEYQGHPVFDIRAWYLGVDDTLKPGKSGICLSIAQHLEPMQTCLAEAVEVAREQGLLTKEGKRDD